MVALAGLICTGCNESPTELRFLDLMVTRGLRVDGKPLRARETLCADETWVVVTLDSERSVTAAVDLHERPVLTLAGCLECADGVPTDLEGSLLGTVRVSNGRGIEFRVDFDVARGWWEHEVDLGQIANRQAELEFEAELPEGCKLRLREVTVRQRRVPAKHPPEPSPQVLLISVDTLRHDAVGAFGGSVATPHLDRFAAEAEIWTRHYAAASWTKPSHASMLTGFHPDTHRAVQLNDAIDPAIPTLAERFRTAGFTTSALVFDCAWLSPRWGFGKGFDSFQVTRWRAGRQTRAVSEWVLAHRDEPFFFFFHTFEPHSDFKLLPYEAPGLNQAAIAESFGVSDFGCRKGRCASQLLNALYRDEVPREPLDTEILRHSYDAGVRYLDASLGALFDSLRSSELWDQMLVVVTSDHGEEFAEHGGFGHHTLYEEILRVPLLVKWPRGDHAGTINEALSSSVDLAPTLLEVAGLPADDLPGDPLRRRPAGAPVFAGTLARAVVQGDDKGIFGGAGPRRVFDLAADPDEELNLVDLDSQRSRALETLLREHRRQALALYRRIGSQHEPGEVVLSDRERERLKAFGYLQ
jgi:arylsulfatase A-like enzyme